MTALLLDLAGQAIPYIVVSVLAAILIVGARSRPTKALQQLAMKRVGNRFEGWFEGVKIIAQTNYNVRSGGDVVLTGPDVAASCPTIRQAEGGHDISTGDPSFDDSVHIEAASDALALAYLHHDARRVCIEAIRLGAALDGRWTARVTGARRDDIATMAKAIAVATKAMTLPESTSVRAQLLATAQADGTPGVQARAIQLLASGDGVPAELAQALCTHPDPAVRCAIGHLGGPIARRAMRGLLTEDSGRWRILAAIELAKEPLEDQVLIEQVLMDALDDEAHGEEAASALIPIASPRVLPALSGRADTPALQRVRSALRARYRDHAGSVSMVASIHEGAVSLAAQPPTTEGS